MESSLTATMKQKIEHLKSKSKQWTSFLFLLISSNLHNVYYIHENNKASLINAHNNITHHKNEKKGIHKLILPLSEEQINNEVKYKFKSRMRT